MCNIYQYILGSLDINLCSYEQPGTRRAGSTVRTKRISPTARESLFLPMFVVLLFFDLDSIMFIEDSTMKSWFITGRHSGNTNTK